ncbi:MAG: hypothetical protein EBT67_08020 [Betaproteobacteria bacterium]|nr:hypothetical protein [Betaproteobacteria bacterium]
MLLGHGNKSIAAVTGVMPDTVKKHRAQVFEKMQVASLADLLALWAIVFWPDERCANGM